MTKWLYFRVDGGSTLELCKAHIKDRVDVLAEQREMLSELGDVAWSQSPIDGRVWGVKFKDGKRHPEFMAPNKFGMCSPKKKSIWRTRIAAGRGWDKGGHGVAKSLGVPTTISYRYGDGHGSMVARPGIDAGVGFLWCDQDNGPFGLYVYDVQSRVKDLQDEGYEIEEPAASWRPDFDGASPIHENEWDLIVAQYRVAKLKEAA